MVYFLCILAVVAVAGYRLFFYRRQRRKQVASRTFPDSWRERLNEDMALYRQMPPEVREQVESGILILLDELEFYGCDGLTVTEEMRLLIAAHGALLICGLNLDYYDSLRAVLLYPDAYRAPADHHDGFVYTEAEDHRLGESWGEGRVILTWSTLQQEAAQPNAASNVALHEFAHQLDQLDGASDGAPPLHSDSEARTWEAVFNDAWERLKQQAYSGTTVLDPYGATDPAEFFAVATETFFCRPSDLRAEEPHLYKCLEGFFRLSPADWPAMHT
ncbi:M90 family metallopeptidase [Marinobacter fonticola]|uniref:M90 family metallopeptidase n=1 Tax=Marinobacter fonticola TaxID=2603215 RepID=UPI00143DB124|nr:M90 family metallopeptidase [Marinobacter fonticola]